MSDEGPTLPGLLRRAAAAEPDRVAVAVVGGERLTYAEWAHRSDALARGLRRTVGAGERVALAFDRARWADYAVAYLAVHKAGAVAVPLGPALGAIEVRRILGDCEASAVLTAPDLAPRGTSVPVFELGELEGQPLAEPLVPFVPPTALAEILYRSRPLSFPTLVPRSHAALLAGLSLALDHRAGDRSLLHAFEVGTLAGQAALAACLGPATVSSVVLPAFDPDRLCALLDAGPVPACGLHPSSARALLASGAPTRHDFPRVGLLVLASGRVAPELLLRLGAAFPQAELLLADVLGHPSGIGACFSHDRSRPGALGTPVAGAAVWVADRSGEPAVPREVGRVRVGAATAGGERRRDADEDDGPDDRLGWVDDRGVLYVVAGRHELVRRRGAPVLRAEVESALREHPAVRDAALLGVPDDRSGPELAAAVVVDRPASAAELKELVRRQLGDDKAPDRILLLDELPRGRAGALLRGKLRRALGLVAGDGGPRSAPAEVRETVAAVCARVLRRDDVEPGDDLVELGGGTSAVAAVRRLLEDAFELRLPASVVCEAPTVASLASAVARLRASCDEGDEGPPAPPVAFSQEGMLWHELFAPGCQNLPGLGRRYRGRLNVAALSRALDEIVRRHGALRTGFELREGRALQAVRPHRPSHLAIRDLTALAPPEREAEVERLVAEAGRRPFDLVVDPLFEPVLLRVGEEDHVLVIRAHHSVFDDWSVGVFRRELASLYAAYAAGAPSPLPEPAVQFADFARRQRSTLAGRAGTRQLSFWRLELAGAPLATQLPVDDPDAPEGSPQPAGEPVSLALPGDLHDRLRALARRERATVFMTVLAAFGVLVQRYTGQDDLVLATVVANRNRTELEGLIGCFTKKLPLRLRLGGDPTFSEVLARTRTALLGALSNQDLPFEAVVQDVLGGAAASHGLVPHLALMFQGVTPRHELVLPGVETVGLETATSARRAHFMATDERSGGDVPPPWPWGAGLYAGTFAIVSVDESEAGLSCSVRGAFHAPAVRRLLESFQTLLADVAADPARRASELALLDRRAATEVLRRGRGPFGPPPAETALGAFHAQVGRAPEAIAVRTQAEALTYAELDDRSDRLSERLRALGAGPGSAVGVALDPSPDVAVAVLAAWKAGAAWVALDPADAGERLARIVREASLELVVGDPRRRGLGEHARVVSAQADGGRRAASAPAAVGPGEAAVVFYGSGRSAVDRGVVLDHRAVSNLVAGLRRDIHRRPGRGAGGRRVCLCPPATDDAFLRQLAALLDGHCLRIPDRPLHADPSETVRLLGAGEVDLVDCTADGLRALLDAGLEDVLRKGGGGPAEPVLVVGTRAPLAPELWRTLCGLTGVRAHAVYGPPECAFGAMVAAPARRAACRPLANVSSYVLDPRGDPVPVRAVGELHIGGPGLARGRPDRPDAADGRFIERPLGGERTRLYRTGQLARSFPDGGVELLGPIEADHDLRGFWVDPTRIGAALSGCPGVGDVTVTLQRDERGEPSLAACVVPDGRPPTLSELRTFLWTRLPGYAWPASLVVVPRPTAAGRAESAAGGGSQDAADPGAQAGVHESVLGSLWSEVVGAERMAPAENYWQAFSFVEALARARDEGIRLPDGQVTRNRTIEALATSLDAGRHPQAPPES